METPPTPDPSPERPPINPSRLIKMILVFLRHRLSLDDDNADPQETIDYIRKGVEFKGTNIWILVFAILIASIGLNMNSAAVIIGAMLISPLMGPIMGLGMGVGINDFPLIRKSAVNLGLMVAISVFTSALYFFLSPLSDAQSELLARTQPTIWDVLIGLFGGLAGIVAGSRKEKSNAIPGVAIATALMPPLCTAGYGLATGNLAYFFGAFYLFTINSVFISFSTIIIVRFLRYPHVSFVNEARERQVKRGIAALLVIVTLPAIYIAFQLVQNTVFEREAIVFVNEQFHFDQCQVISKTATRDGDTKKIEVALIGEPLDETIIESIRSKMEENDRLQGATLIVRQGALKKQGLDMQTVEMMNQNLKTGIIEDLYKRNEEVLESKDQRISVLEDELYKIRSKEFPIDNISLELKAEHESVVEFTLSINPIINMDNHKVDTVTFAYVSFKSRPRKEEISRLENWLKARTKADSLKLVTFP